jgi:hypothetical protein
MRLCLSLAFALAVVAPAVGADSKDPLRFFPEQTDVVLKVEKPRALVEAVLKNDLAKEAQELQLVRDFLDSTNYRRFFQLVTHFERELGAPWPELIDKLAGGGMAGGFKVAPDANQPILLVIQGTDEKTVSKFFDLAVSLFEEERQRQGATEPLKRKTYEGFDGIEIDKEAIVAHSGDVLLFSNKGEALKAGIDQMVKGRKDPDTRSIASIAPKQAADILPPNPAAWFWVNLKPLKEQPQLKETLKTPRENVILTLAVGDILDVVRRSDFVAAGLYADHDEFRLAVRMPAGRKGMATDAEMHLPRDPKVGGSLPLLEPDGVLFSYSFFLDLDTLYRKRDQIFPPQIAKDFAEGEKQASRFLIGSSLPKFLSQGPVHYRIVATKPETVGDYKTQPDQKLPAFALVLSMRDPEFAKTMKVVIKAGAVAAGQAASLKSWEEEIAGVPVFGYSFPEEGKFPDDPQKLRFNYQPTFGAYKDQYLLASNRGLFRELVALLDKEDRSKPMSPNSQIRVYASGAGAYANAAPDQTLAATIIGQGVKVGDARKQAEALFKFLEKLGTAGFRMNFTDDQFQVDLSWKTKK